MCVDGQQRQPGAIVRACRQCCLVRCSAPGQHTVLSTTACQLFCGLDSTFNKSTRPPVGMAITVPAEPARLQTSAHRQMSVSVIPAQNGRIRVDSRQRKSNTGASAPAILPHKVGVHSVQCRTPSNFSGKSLGSHARVVANTCAVRHVRGQRGQHARGAALQAQLNRRPGSSPSSSSTARAPPPVASSAQASDFSPHAAALGAGLRAGARCATIPTLVAIQPPPLLQHSTACTSLQGNVHDLESKVPRDASYLNMFPELQVLAPQPIAPVPQPCQSFIAHISQDSFLDSLPTVCARQKYGQSAEQLHRLQQVLVRQRALVSTAARQLAARGCARPRCSTATR